MLQSPSVQNCNIALFYTECDRFREFVANVRKGRIQERTGESDKITNLRILMQRAKEHQQAIYMCFVD